MRCSPEGAESEIQGRLAARSFIRRFVPALTLTQAPYRVRSTVVWKSERARRNMDGGCFCGRVRYRAASIFDCLYCHCSECRKASGGTFAVVAVVLPQDFWLIKGQPETYRRENGYHCFCGGCGSPLFYPAGTYSRSRISFGRTSCPGLNCLMVCRNSRPSGFRIPTSGACDNPYLRERDGCGPCRVITIAASHKGGVRYGRAFDE